MKIWQRWKQTAIHNKALVLTSILVAFGTLFYAATAVFQLWMMDRSSKHTDEQIGYIIGNINWMARSMDWNQKVAQQGIESSSRQSQKALDATIANFHNDQRAWMAVKDAHDPLNAPPVTMPTVTFLSTGHTPALEVTAYINRDWFPLNSKPNFETKGIQRRLGLLSPGPERTVQYDSLPMQKGKMLYVWGTFTYRDIFQTCHWITFCLRTPADGKFYAFCEEHNDTDRNDEIPTKEITCPVPAKP